MEPRTRLFVWAGMLLLTAISLQPAGEVLAADWRGTAATAEVAPTGAPVETADLPATPAEDAVDHTSGRRS